MRRISADYIFPISSEPIKDGMITIDDDGTIIEVNPKSQILNPKSEIEYHKGIICPGFINTHCHLELSYLYKHISESTGMTGFIKELVSKRFTFSEEQIQQSIIDAETEMIKNGIVAVGDISNNNSTFQQKAKHNLLYHTFIEIFNIDDTAVVAAAGTSAYYDISSLAAQPLQNQMTIGLIATLQCINLIAHGVKKPCHRTRAHTTPPAVYEYLIVSDQWLY